MFSCEVGHGNIKCQYEMITDYVDNHRLCLMYYKHASFCLAVSFYDPLCLRTRESPRPMRAENVIWSCCECAFALLRLNK